MKRRLWLQWVLASAIGCAVVSTVARRVSMAVGGAAGDAMGPLVAEVVVGALALGGVMLGIAVGPVASRSSHVGLWQQLTHPRPS